MLPLFMWAFPSSFVSFINEATVPLRPAVGNVAINDFEYLLSLYMYVSISTKNCGEIAFFIDIPEPST